ncbi:MAG: PKD domain-containing protein [Candidatus Thermoplasmatota archaeon]|nr:PKD domain-containing protein [Candidatus Thermoplasmatota archaeon]
MNNKKIVSVLALVTMCLIIIGNSPVSACCYYEVGTFESDYTSAKNFFYKGEIVYGKGVAHFNSYPLKLRIIDPNDNIVYYSDESTSVVYGLFFLNETATAGTWVIQLGIYKSCKWQWSDSSDRTAYFTVSDANFTLNVNIDGNGNVIVEPELNYYPYGSLVNLTAVPGNGWSFGNWTGDICSSNSFESIVMYSNKTVTATFTQNQYELNVNVVGNGTVVKEPDKTFYVYGDVVNLSCLNESGWFFVCWEGDILGSDNPAVLTIDDNKNVTAVFDKSLYSITIIVDGDGFVNVDPEGPYYYGETVFLTAVANNGTMFSSWSGDLNSTNASEVIVIDSNKTVVAHFIKTQEGGGGLNNGGGGRGAGSVKPNKVPVADLSAGEPYIGFVEEEIEFNGSLSYDLDGKIVEYTWVFGDGATGTGEITTHAYLAPGEYKVELKVKDNRGSVDTDETIAIVVLPNTPPSKPVITGPAEGFVNTSYVFNVVSVDDDFDAVKYIINWGDGNTSESDYILSSVLYNVSYKWLKPGQYKIVVTADDGKTNSTEEFIINILEQEKQVFGSSNFILVILAIIALLSLLLFLLLAKKENEPE